MLDSCRALEELEGCEITYLPVQKNGLIDLVKLKDAIREDTVLVRFVEISLMH